MNFDPKNLVELDRLVQTFGTQCSRTVVRGQAVNTEIVQRALADFLGVARRPVIVRRVELNHLISHFGDGTHCTHEVFCKLVANRIEFQANRNLWCGRFGKSQRCSAEQSHKRSARNGIVLDHEGKAFQVNLESESQRANRCA